MPVRLLLLIVGLAHCIHLYPDTDDDGDGISDDEDYNDYDYAYEDYYDDTDNDGIPDSEDLDDDNDGIVDEYDNDDDNDGILDSPVISNSDKAEVDEEGLEDPSTTPAPLTVQSCCPPCSRLSLKSNIGTGYFAKCIKMKRHIDAEEMDFGLVISGSKLPQCSRGMQVEKVGIKTREKLRVTTTTSAPEEEEELYEEQFMVKNYYDSIPYGWHLASVPHVLASSGSVKQEVRSAMSDWEWGIVCLDNDARLLGGGYSYKIETDMSCENGNDHLGHKIIFTAGKAIRPSRSTTTPAPAKEYGAALSSSGKLIIQDKAVEQEAFCIETTWDEWDSSDWNYKDNSEDGEALAVTCDMCKEEVVCSYLKMLYNVMDTLPAFQTKIATAIIGSFNNFEEFKAAAEKFIKEFWNLTAGEDGTLDNILNQPKVKISSNFLLKLTQFLFDKLDVDLDDELSATDWMEVTGEKEKSKKVGRTLISLPSPIYTLYTRLDQDRNQVLTLQELNIFIIRTFAMLDKTKDCLVDLDDVIATLNESKLPKDFQLGFKQLVQQQLTIGNHALNRVFEVADANHDNITEADEILQFSNFNFIESEVQNMMYLAQPNMPVVNYLHGGWEESEAWLETLQNLMMNKAYRLEDGDIKCGGNSDSM